MPQPPLTWALLFGESGFVVHQPLKCFGVANGMPLRIVIEVDKDVSVLRDFSDPLAPSSQSAGPILSAVLLTGAMKPHANDRPGHSPGMSRQHVVDAQTKLVLHHQFIGVVGKPITITELDHMRQFAGQQLGERP